MPTFIMSKLQRADANQMWTIWNLVWQDLNFDEAEQVVRYLKIHKQKPQWIKIDI